MIFKNMYTKLDKNSNKIKQTGKSRNLNLGLNFSLAESEIRLCGSGLLLPQVWQLQGFGPHLPLVPLVAGIAKLKTQF